MIELKRWIEFINKGTGGDLGDALLRLTEIVEYGASFDDVGVGDRDEWWGELETMRDYLDMFARLLFEPLPEEQQEFGSTNYSWIKRLEEVDSRDLVLREEDGYAVTFRLAFDPQKLFDQINMIDERIITYLGQDDNEGGDLPMS